jgi:hypothetical protein
VADIFLSYAREDKETARRLADAIEVRGFSVWWDAEIPPGKTWDQMIEQELSAARCAIVLWSKTSVTKTWVRAEANEALKRGILIPTLIDAVEPPLAFRLTQAASLVGWRGEEDHPGFQQLLGAFERLVRDPSVEPQLALQAARIHSQPPPGPRPETSGGTSAIPPSASPRWRLVLAAVGGTVLAASIAFFVFVSEKKVAERKTGASTTESVDSARASAQQSTPRTNLTVDAPAANVRQSSYRIGEKVLSAWNDDRCLYSASILQFDGTNYRIFFDFGSEKTVQFSQLHPLSEPHPIGLQSGTKVLVKPLSQRDAWAPGTIARQRDGRFQVLIDADAGCRKGVDHVWVESDSIVPW